MKNFLEFLTLLALNNNREWFEKNKALYEEARSQVELVVKGCISALGTIQDLGNCEAKSCMFRIYRDVRFSKNKNPYKSNFAALIGPGGKKSKDILSWYLHFQPGGSFLAAGLYEPDKVQLAKVRQEIDFNGEKLKSILQNPDFQKNFGALKGNQLKTIPKGYDKSHIYADLLKFNQFYIMHSFNDADVLSSDFSEKVKLVSKKAYPFLGFFKEALA